MRHRLLLTVVVLGNLTIANALNYCILDDFSSLLQAENAYGKINRVAGPCTDREEEKSYLTVGRGVFMPFVVMDNDFAGSFCIGFLVDTSPSNTAPLAYFHDTLGGILGNLTLLPDSIILNIKGNEAVFSEKTVGFKRYQLCREGDLMTLYDDCSAVASLSFPKFDPGFDNKNSVELLRDLTSSQPIFQNSVTQFYFFSCTGPLVTQKGMAQVQCDSSPVSCTKPFLPLERVVNLYEAQLNGGTTRPMVLHAAAIQKEHSWTLRDTEEYDVDAASGSGGSGDQSPGQPNVRVGAVDATFIRISWSVPYSSLVTGYEVMWQRDTSIGCADEDEGNVTIGKTVTHYLISRLQEDSRYRITVTATNSMTRVVSNPVTALTEEAVPSAAPNPVSVARNSFSITIQWEAVDCIHHNGNITGYSVRYRAEGTEGEKTVEMATGDFRGGSHRISRLNPATVYIVEVAAVNSAGTGVYSDPITAMTSGGVVLSSNVVASSTSLTFLWTLVGGVTATSAYVIYYSNTNNQCFVNGGFVIAHNNAIWKTLFDLEEGTQYSITVTVILSDGKLGADNITATTTATAPSAAPTSVNVSEVTYSNITVQWGEVECIHRNGDVTEYSVRYWVNGSDEGNKTIEMATGDSSGGMYTISGLSAATVYTVEVAAVNSADTGVYSDPIDQLTSVTAPSITVDPSSVTPTTIPLTWTSAGSVVDSYDVIWTAEGECSGVSGGNASIDGDTISYTIEGLEEYITYIITVTATNAIGTAVSEKVTRRTSQATPSAAPTSVNVSAVTSSSITVQWGAVDCIHHNGNITAYSVQYWVQGSHEGDRTVEMATGDSRGGMYTISGLSAATVYAVEVAAANNASIGEYSDPITAETLQKQNVSSSNSTPRSEQNFSSTIAVGISAIVVIGILAVISVIILYLFFKKKKVKDTEMARDLNVNTYLENQYALVQPNESPLLQQLRRELRDKRMIVSKDQIHLTSAVGHGESGLVYKGYINTPLGSELVAVKTGKALFSSGDLERLTKEISTMLSFEHPNVMSLVGVCLDGEMPLLIMPFMPNGNILQYVRHHKQELLLTSEATDEEVQAAKETYLKMCHEITKGMTYLAKEKFVHRDLAARNCMIDGHGVIKVADFGLTEDMYSTNYFRRDKDMTESEEKVPIRWMAPESIENDIYNESTDVWSFGVTVWELFTCGSVPYSGIPVMSVLRALKAGHRLEEPENTVCSNEIYDLMTSCWNLDSHQRPKFANLQCDVCELLEAAAGYMELSSSFKWKKEEELEAGEAAAELQSASTQETAIY